MTGRCCDRGRDWAAAVGRHRGRFWWRRRARRVAMIRLSVVVPVLASASHPSDGRLSDRVLSSSRHATSSQRGAGRSLRVYTGRVLYHCRRALHRCRTGSRRASGWTLLAGSDGWRNEVVGLAAGGRSSSGCPSTNDLVIVDGVPPSRPLRGAVAISLHHGGRLTHHGCWGLSEAV